MKHPESDDEEVKPNWPVIRDLFSQVIEPARTWEQADCLGELNDMAKHFTRAFPGVFYSIDDMKLALHDLNIPLERNEHNNRFYYLAKWR